MARKLTATILFALMTLIVITSQHGVNYCTCLKEFSVGDCGCVENKATESCCSHSDHSESCSTENLSQASGSLCDSSGCLISLFIETPDFLNSYQEFGAAGKNGNGTSARIEDPNLTLSAFFLPSSSGNRGPPRTVAFSESVPLFIRHSVFLI